MDNNFETTFIKETKEKTPFADIPTKKFFSEWCRINDSISPEFVTRGAWEQRGVQGILEKNDQGKQTLFLPEDLHLWEMVDIIKTVDHDTLDRNPEKREERANKLKNLGQTFEKAGLYLSEYLPVIGEDEENAKQFADNIAHEFYQYGLSLQNKKEKEDVVLPQESSLVPEDKTELDEWFLGKNAYQKRLTRLGENPTEEQIEETRKKLLRVYFKSLAREGYKAKGEKPGETEVGPRQHLQDRTRRQITKAIEAPERELKTAIFRRGVKKLVTEIKEVGWRKAINDLLKKVGFDPLLEQRKLYETLHVDGLKAELEKVRGSGDIAKISAKELEIAKKIQKAVSGFPYKHDDEETKERIGNNPTKMVETQFINCVGSSILGGGLLDEVGIKYLHADLSTHSATVLVTSDGKAYWQDFTPGNLKGNFTEITPDMITKDFSIADFVNQLSDSGISLSFRDWNPYHHVGGKLRVNLFNPEIGLQCHILNNTGEALSDLGRSGEAIEAYQQAISVDPKYEPAFYNLGLCYEELGRNKEAIDSFKRHNEIVGNPDDDWAKRANQSIANLEEK